MIESLVSGSSLIMTYPMVGLYIIVPEQPLPCDFSWPVHHHGVREMSAAFGFNAL